eukprot:Hpha_TRINITY_DN29829_c0_g1::TRINITY_DN29829_c0_g1_i1::g.2892::m.2892/K18426/ECHDC1; ethylmalonyl-CoA/methylmalonyl-CoA decarboxylase
MNSCRVVPRDAARRVRLRVQRRAAENSGWLQRLGLVRAPEAAPRPTVDVADAPEPATPPAVTTEGPQPHRKPQGPPLTVRPGRRSGQLFPAAPAREEVQAHAAEVKEPRTQFFHADLPHDPTSDFLRQGRELLSDMQDGGRVACIAETGVQGVWCLQLENLEHNNAITGDMMLELEETMRMVNRAIKTNHEIMALVVRGSGLNFSHGTAASVHQEKWWKEEGAVLSRYMNAITLELSSLPIVTIAAIEGVCAGTAAELAAACDFRVMSSEGMMQFADTHLGLTPGWGGAQRMAKITSSRAALLMIASGKPCSANDALDLGLADSLSRPGEAYDDAIEFIRNNLHDYSGIGGTHGELTWRRESIRMMKDNIVAADLFESVEAIQGTEQRNFRRSWDLNAKVMTERRMHAIGLNRAGVNRALEAWAVVTDPFATTIPPEEDVGKHGLTPASNNTRWGKMAVSTMGAFDTIMARKPHEPLPSSPESGSFLRGQQREQGMLEGAWSSEGKRPPALPPG